MSDDQVTVVGFDGDDLGKTARRIAALVVQRAIFLNDRNTAVAHSGDDAVLGHAVLPGVPRDPDPLHASSMYSILGMCQSVNGRPFDAIALVSVRLCHVQTDPTDSCGGRDRPGHFSSFFGGGTSNTHPDHDEDERIGVLSFPLGKQQRPAAAVVAGDICAIGKLSRAETGDTLSDKAEPLVLKPWTMPEPLLPIAIAAHAKTDEDKLSVGLGRLAAEDPTLRIEQNQETHQVVLWCMGEAHAGVVLDTLANRYGVSVDTIELRVPLRETFAGNAKGHGRHIKQSGGHGQYGVCDIEVEPLPEGSGFEFLDKVVGGAVPRQFIPSVEKGVRAQMDKGVHAGYPVVDIRVTLLDGKAHSVDSSDFAFQMAGALALREAAAATKVILLEPIDEISVLVPDDFVGAVLGDLSSRRGRVLGTETAGHDRTVIKAEVPQVELTRYAIDLRSLAHGAASFTRSFARYEPMPESAAARVKAGAG